MIKIGQRSICTLYGMEQSQNRCCIWKYHLWLTIIYIFRRYPQDHPTEIQIIHSDSVHWINWTQSNESQLHKLPLELWNSVTQTFESRYSVSMNRSLLLWCIASCAVCVCACFLLYFPLSGKFMFNFNYDSHWIVCSSVFHG